ERVDAERAQCVLLVGRQEDHGRHLVRADLGDHAEAVQARHLDVEEHEIGLELSDCADGARPVAAAADDLDVALLRERQRDSLARERLVVDDQRAELHCATNSAVGSNGTRTSMRVPAPGLLVNENVWRRPSSARHASVSAQGPTLSPKPCVTAFSMSGWSSIAGTGVARTLSSQRSSTVRRSPKRICTIAMYCRTSSSSSSSVTQCRSELSSVWRKTLLSRPSVCSARSLSPFLMSTETAFLALNRKCGSICMRSVCSCSSARRGLSVL